MTNVISFASCLPNHKSGPSGLTALTGCFASGRRVSEDVFWLKENAELLNVCECSGVQLGQAALEPYRAFYQSAQERLVFFPQYYRFLLGIVLDLEALALDDGLDGGLGEQMCAHVARSGLIEAELSDLQRGEAMRLLSRKGFDTHGSAELDARLHRFIANSDTFSVPNRKAAYELTHIVFYLTDYGRKSVTFAPGVEESLTFTGILALLEDNTDLLAEVCVAMHFAGIAPPKAWERHLIDMSNLFQVRPGLDGQNDDYHTYLMVNWALGMTAKPIFTGQYGAHGTSFFSGFEPRGALRTLSYVLYNLCEHRVGSWNRMKRELLPQMGQDLASHIKFVEHSTPYFDAFFTKFARALPQAAQARSIEMV